MNIKKRSFIAVILVVLSVALFSPLHNVQADVAPPNPPPGGGIQPFEQGTMVQMVAEQILINVSDQITSVFSDPDEYENWTGQMDGYGVSFQTTFWMQNQGENAESMAVRFPLNAFNGYSTFYRINDFSVRVNGTIVDWQISKHSESDMEEYNWASFDVTFPPGEVLLIQVTYSTITYSIWQIPLERIDYILNTGSGWYGPIDFGEIILSLPYEASPMTVPEEYSRVPSDTVFFNGKAHWYFHNLEPESSDDLRIYILPPQDWQELTTYREILQNDPENLFALINFGNAATQLCINKKVFLADRFPELYQEGLEALETAAARLPEDLEVQTMYTNALIAQVGVIFMKQLTDQELGNKIVQQRLILVELDPDHELIPFLDRILSYYYLNLTATPTPRPTYTPSNTPTPTLAPSSTPAPPTQTATPRPSPTVTPSPTPEQICIQQSDVLGWGTILLVFLLAGGVTYGKDKFKKHSPSA